MTPQQQQQQQPPPNNNTNDPTTTATMNGVGLDNDPDITLSDTFDDPSHNPFADDPPEEDEEEDQRSVASQQLRNDFIRLTSQSAPQAEDNHNYNYDSSNGYYEQPSPNTTTTTTTTNPPTTVVPDPEYQYYDYSNYNQNGYVTIRNTTQGQSLAKAPTTPLALATLLPFACILTHILFLYGQVAVMWKLELTTSNIDFTAKSGGTTSKLLFNALGLADPYHFTHPNQHEVVKEFTYGYAVQELWEAKGMKASGVWLAKIAAIGLVVFSGIWPHVKLLLLQFAWSKRTTNPNRRTRTLSWLALLGKWSLADVLTVCVMVGVLNLQWTLQPPNIQKGVLNNLHTLLDISSQIWTPTQVCNNFLNFDATDCNHVKDADGNEINDKVQKAKDMVQCRLCKDFVKSAFQNPDTVEKTGKTIVEQIVVVGNTPNVDGGGGTNGGSIRLSVIGMKGIYYFCTAVILSVLLSVIVEWYNHLFLETLRKEQRSNRGENQQDHTLSLTEEDDDNEQQQEQNQTTTTTPSSPTGGVGSSTAISDESDASEPLLSLEDAPPQYEPMEIMDPDDRSVFNSVVQRTTSTQTYQWLQCQYLLPLITLLFVGLAVYLPSMERHVGGGIPDLLKDILDIRFDKTYSLATLRDTTGAAGGWDYLLMATFALFVVIGPLLRAILVVFVAITKSTDDTRNIRSLLVRASNFLAAFCAWEVFLVAMIMVELIMPMATETILNTPACHIVSHKDEGSCLQVSYERVPITFLCLVVGFVLIGGLSIHVSQEDKKERKSLAATGGENGGGRRGGEMPTTTTNNNNNNNNNTESNRNHEQGPPLEINTTPSYAMASDNTTVITMMQEEMV